MKILKGKKFIYVNIVVVLMTAIIFSVLSAFSEQRSQILNLSKINFEIEKRTNSHNS